jgi:3-methylcrotonyl-CoA carboxylase alpha subunit
MFKKILIANRGEIACRVASSARRLGVRTAAVYSDADAGAAHVVACDEAWYLGGSAPADSYLRGQRIIELALACGAEAVHPGYGFLSENEGFAQACSEAGLVFIGPRPGSIAAMGLKAEAKRLMAQAGVPLVPGYHGAEQDLPRLQQEADRIGYPVMIKASAGGGGKGMRMVERRADFAAALASCQREARSSFGDAAVLIEKYLQRPRHVEVQIFGDRQGQLVHLFERDCSVQRRHQKVLEEAPAPGLPQAMRAAMGAAAVAAARAVAYEGAGTVEFMVEQRDDGTMDFYFMEMNTRLQVEHPVTEAICGLDLVEWQLRVASGEALPLRQEALRCNGHAIEARICAENPAQQFLPASGRLAVWALPSHMAFAGPAQGLPRIDAGVRAGDLVTPHYDPMLAKLIVHGATREQALARMDQALAALHIVGLHNNVQFLRSLLATPSFSQPELDTGLIVREQARLSAPCRLSRSLALAAVVGHELLAEQRTARQARAAGAGPFADSDGWQPYCVQRRQLQFQCAPGQPDAAAGAARGEWVEWHCASGGAYQLRVGEQCGPFRFEPVAGEAAALRVEFAGQQLLAWVYAQGERRQVHTREAALELALCPAVEPFDLASDCAGQLSAPMPGKLIAFYVGCGERVQRGQALAVLEAMKMEHTIHAPADGRVEALLYTPGDAVDEGAALLTLQAS